MTLLLQERDFRIQTFVANYGVVTRRQICEELKQPDRSMRRRLAELAKAGYLKRHAAPRCDGMNSIPVYASTRKGLQALAQQLEDDSLVHFPTGFPISQNLTHSVEVAQTHILLTKAIAAQEIPRVHAGFWFNEDQKITPFVDPKKTTVIASSTKPTLCRPDAAFSLRASETHCLFFLEEDRSTTWVQRVMKKKLPGYEFVFNSRAHRQHYSNVAPDLSDTFRVIFMCPTDKRRDSLRREAARQLAGKDPLFVDCFRFVSKYGPEKPLTAERLLFESIALRCGDETPMSLVRMPEALSAESTTIVKNSSTSLHGQGGQAGGHLEAHINA